MCILNLQKRYESLWDRYQRKTLFIVDVSIGWAPNRNWQTKVLDTWKVTQLTSLRQKSVKSWEDRWPVDSGRPLILAQPRGFRFDSLNLPTLLTHFWRLKGNLGTRKTALYWCERRSKPQKREMYIPFGTYIKGRHFSSLTFLLTTQLAEGGRPNFLMHGRYLRYIYFVRKELKCHVNVPMLAGPQPCKGLWAGFLLV